MWKEDIPKGRGVSIELDRKLVLDVVNTLALHNILLKKTSQGRKKYGLNPKLRVEIMQVIDHAEFPKELEGIRRILYKDKNLMSARELDIPGGKAIKGID